MTTTQLNETQLLRIGAKEALKGIDKQISQLKMEKRRLMKAYRLRGRPPNGPLKKLTTSQVVGIKLALAEEGASVSKLAKTFGVSRQQIYHIKNGTTWAEV